MISFLPSIGTFFISFQMENLCEQYFIGSYLFNWTLLSYLQTNLKFDSENFISIFRGANFYEISLTTFNILLYENTENL